MKIKLLRTTHIPDETFVPDEKNQVVPTATNYAGAELTVSAKLAKELIDSGAAEAVGEAGEQPPPIPALGLEG